MERIWLKSYPPGVAADVTWDTYKSLGDLFEQCVKKYAGKPAYHNMGRTITYAEVDRHTRAFAAWLQSYTHGSSPHAVLSICRDRMAANSSAKPSRRAAWRATSLLNLL